MPKPVTITRGVVKNVVRSLIIANVAVFLVQLLAKKLEQSEKENGAKTPNSAKELHIIEQNALSTIKSAFGSC